MATPYHYSDIGLALTMQFEGCELHAYTDTAGVLTIGYGHTGKDVHWGMKITQAQAIILLKSDLAAAETCVAHAVKVPIEQHQFDAMVDFTFNLGRGHFLTSHLLLAVNAKDFDGAAAQFALWKDVGGKPCEAIERRRAAEEAMFRRAA